MPMNWASVTVLNLQKLRYRPMMKGTTKPIMNAANVGRANSAHHLRIALPVIEIMPAYFLLLEHTRTTACEWSEFGIVQSPQC